MLKTFIRTQSILIREVLLKNDVLKTEKALPITPFLCARKLNLSPKKTKPKNPKQNEKKP